MQILANLLWAACGINRPQSGNRTAPSAHNWQEIDVYLLVPHWRKELYLYNPKTHTLEPVVKSDLRKHTARLPQPSRSGSVVGAAQLIYVIRLCKNAIRPRRRRQEILLCHKIQRSLAEMSICDASEGLYSIIGPC